MNESGAPGMNEEAREYERRDGYLYARLYGEYSAQNNLTHLRAVLAECRKLGFDRVLCDMTGETGELSFLSRFHLSEEAGSFWDPKIKIVVLAREDQMDKDRFGIKVARNRGADAQIFSDPAQALAWLLA